jgi:Beta-propeller repeat
VFKQSAEKIWMPAVWVLVVAIVGVAAIAGSSHLRTRSARNSSTQVPASAAQRGRLRADLDALPLAFEANQGQTDPQVKYMARGKGYTAFLTADETVFAMQAARANAGITGKRALLPAQKADKATKVETGAIRMKLVGANENAPIAAESELPGHSNYFIGNDRSQWHVGVKQYARVSYNQVYPGVNLAFHGQQKQLEFDFIVAPGADPKAIRFNVAGAKKISTDSTGDLVLASAAGDVVLHKPVTHQRKENVQQAVESRFVIAKNTVSFEVGNYDRGRELVIDPSVTYATFLGGSAEDDAYGIAVDGSGNAYVTGQTKSYPFPSATGTNTGFFDIFVTEISADGSKIVYSTLIGGSGSGNGDSSGNAIAVDSGGSAYVAGGTGASTGFPTTSGVYEPNFHTGTGTLDGFICKLNATTGTLSACTYIGGSGDDVVNGIAVTSSGIYVGGNTTSSDFQATLSNAYQTSLKGSSNGFITVLDTGLTTASYSTFLGVGGESLNGIAVDSSSGDSHKGDAYVTGAVVNATFPPTTNAYQTNCSSCSGFSDAFVSVIDPSKAGGASLVYSTFLGGSKLDQGFGIAVDSSGDAYITGVTQSPNFPMLPSPPTPPLKTFGGFQNAFVTRLSPAGNGTSDLVYSAYLGGTDTTVGDLGAAIALDSSNNAYVSGLTNSSDFPTASPTQPNIGGQTDAFVSEITPSAQLAFSTFLGGSQSENQSAKGNLTGTGAIAVDKNGANIYVAGSTPSATDFPTHSAKQSGYGGGTNDAFVAKYSTGASSANFTITNGALSPTSGHAGVSANATVTVTSTAGFSSAVALTCSVSPAATKGPTCSLSPASVTPPANGTVTSTLTVSTTAASARLENPFDGRGMFFATIVPVFGLTLVGAGMGSSDSRRRKLFGLFLLGMLAMSLMLMPACSSSSTTVGGGGGGTPAGAYTITVTGTSGGASATGTPAITLTIN